MRYKRFVAAIIVSFYILSNVSCCFAEVAGGILSTLPTARVYNAVTSNSKSTRSVNMSSIDSSSQDAAATGGKTAGVEADTSTNADDAAQKQQNQEAAALDPTNTEPVENVVNEELPEDAKGATKDAAAHFVGRSTSIDPKEVLGSTMYDNLRGRLVRFGSDFFAKVRTNNLTLAPVGANYVVAPGDQVKVTVWGYNEIRANLVVDRDGSLALPQAGVIEAAGLTFDALRQNIETAYKRIFTDFDLDVSMGKLHTINVYVAGCANKPGAYAVSSMATLIDVLSQAGGPSVQGTMRNIQVKRGNKTVAVFDVYQLLLHGDRKGDTRLCDGDIIFIPPVGKLVAAAGNVKRPAIYEVGKGATLGDLIRLAGGLTSGATKSRIQIVRVEDNTVRTAFEDNLSDAAKKMKLADGDLVKFFAVYGGSFNVRLAGAVVQPGTFAITEGKTTLKELLERAGGVLYTASDDAEMTRIAVSPTGPVTTRMMVNVKDVMSGKENIKLQRDDYIFVRSVPDWDTMRSASIQGRVLYPGEYAIKRGEKLSSLLARSGGFAENAFVRGAVFMRESVRVQQQKAMDEMIMRLDREFASAANESVSSASNANDKDFALAEIQQKERLLQSLRQTKATGRLIINLPTNIAEIKGTAFDIELKDGDRIIIPERPNTVQILGSVTSQSVFVYQPNLTVKDYLDMAGGKLASATLKRSYIIKPNGSIAKAFNGSKAAIVEEGDSIVIPEKMVFSPRLRDAREVLDLLTKAVLSIASVRYIFRQ